MGIASISYADKVFRFRTDPNSIRWTYTLNTNTTNTKGGRVIQVLSARIDDLVVVADAGGGGWDYLHSAALFFRDMMVEQKDLEHPPVFEYPPRGWKMGVYVLNFPFRDTWNDIKREFTITFKVQEDISGIIVEDSVRQEIARLAEGVGWHYNEYNSPNPDQNNQELRQDEGELPQPLPGQTSPGAGPR